MQNEGKAVFWSLRQKFLDSDDDMPAQAQQVMYYSLAIGHHVGVIDCLNTELSCPLPQYQTWVELFPEGDTPIPAPVHHPAGVFRKTACDSVRLFRLEQQQVFSLFHPLDGIVHPPAPGHPVKVFHPPRQVDGAGLPAVAQ